MKNTHNIKEKTNKAVGIVKNVHMAGTHLEQPKY